MYGPIVKFIYHLPFDIATLDSASRKYKTFLDSLAKHTVYADHKDYYRGFNYVTLRNKLHERAKKEPNDLYRLILSLYIDNPVRRTSDYTKILINETSDYTNTYTYKCKCKCNKTIQKILKNNIEKK